MSKNLTCWTRERKDKSKYITCLEGQKQSNRSRTRTTRPNLRPTTSQRLNQLAIERDNLLNTERLIENRMEGDEMDELEEFFGEQGIAEQYYIQNNNLRISNMRRNRNRVLDNRPRNLIPDPTEMYRQQLQRQSNLLPDPTNMYRQQDYLDRTMEEVGVRNLEEFYNVSGITSNPISMPSRVGDYYVDSSGFRVIDNTPPPENPNKLRQLYDRLNYIMGDTEASDYISTLGYTGELLDRMYSDLMGRMSDMEEYDEDVPFLRNYIKNYYKSQRGVRTTFTKLDDDASYPDEFLREIEKFEFPLKYEMGQTEQPEYSEMDYLDYSGDVKYPTKPFRRNIPNKAWYDAMKRTGKSKEEDKYGDKFNPPQVLDKKSAKKSGRTAYTRDRPITQLLTQEYLDYMGLPPRPIRRHGTTGYIRGDGSMEEMTYLLDDMEKNPDKYIGTSYGKRIKEHMEKYNTAYYYGLRRQEPEFKTLSLAKGQHAWNKRSRKMKELLSKI